VPPSVAEKSTSRKRRKPSPGRKTRGRPKPAAHPSPPAARAPDAEFVAVQRVRRAGLSRADLDSLSRTLTWSRPVVPVLEPHARSPARRLHVVMVGWEWPPNHTGGLGVHCFEVCKELTRMGHRVTFLTPFKGPFTNLPGVTIRFPGDAPKAGTWFPPAYWAGETPDSPFRDAMDGYNAWISELRGIGHFDLVHVHDWFGTVGGRELARHGGVPLVVTIHSTEYDRSLGNPWEQILQREQYGIDHADRIIAVSRHLRQQLIDRYHAPPERVRVIYNAVRPSDRLRPLKESQQIVLYLGRLAAMKGVDTFLRAAARVAPTAPDALFVVAGEGPEFPHLLDLATHLGVADRVLFLGKVTEDERAVLLASASVFVLPSIVEPFGIAALEAMAAGVPTIVSKTSGVAEIAQHVFAIDFWDVDEFASRIAELLEYPVLRAAMGEGGRWDALKEGWPERALQTVGVYQEAILSSAQPR
jgi:glycogen synthase